MLSLPSVCKILGPELGEQGVWRMAPLHGILDQTGQMTSVSDWETEVRVEKKMNRSKEAERLFLLIRKNF